MDENLVDANKRPNFSVEEVPIAPEVNAPEATPEVVSPLEVPPVEAPTIVEVPQLPPQTTVSTPPTVITEPTITSAPTAPNTPNVPHKPHVAKKFLFLIPALILIITIAIVAYLTSNNYSVREPAPPAPTPEIAEATPAPTPTVPRTKMYKNDALRVSLMVPEDYDILEENNNMVSFGKDDTEILAIRNSFFYNRNSEGVETAEESAVSGRDVVRFSVPDGQGVVEVVQTLQTPNYEIAMYTETPGKVAEFETILASVIFLIDTTNWETFNNTSYNYTMKHPPEWSVETEETRDGLAPRSEVMKTPGASSPSLVIETSIGLENAGLTASEIVSSTRTLSGWQGTPKVDFRKLGEADAQVIQGEHSGRWQAYIVAWYRNTVVQLVWTDTVEQDEKQVFDNMLASFQFTN